MDLLGPCTNVFLTAYAHVRTEPQSDIGQTRGKKKQFALPAPEPTVRFTANAFRLEPNT